MGRRTAAWIVDFILWLLLGVFLGPTPLSPLAEYVDTNDFPGIDCGDIERVNDFSSCVEIGDRLYFVEGGEAGIAFAVAWIIAPLAYAAFQGATGRSPGKALFGVKVVDEFGNAPGFGKSLVRTLLWVVDGIPCMIPLVGFITGLTSNGHRRVGDMAAKTFVVGRDHGGPVIVAGLPTAATQGYPGAAYGAPGQWGPPPGAPPGAPGQAQPWGAPAPGGAHGGPPPGGWEAQPPGGFPVPGAAPSTGSAGPGPGGPPGTEPSDRPAPPGSWASPGGPSGATGEDDRGRGSAEGRGPAREATDDTTTRPGATAAGTAWTAGTTAASTTPPADTAAADTGTEADAATRPGAGPPTGGTAGAGAGAPGADVPPGTASQAAPSSYNPQWDAARGTYIVWEPNRGKWLGWDESAQEWKPL
jgi:uncharacterized RDD family membrane protein YckC